MADSPSDIWFADVQHPVGVVIVAPRHSVRMADWRVAGVLTGERFAAQQRERRLLRSGPDADWLLWVGFEVRLEASEVEDYVLNLSHEQPSVYVVTRWEAVRGLVPVEVTLSLGQAQQMDATDLRSSEESVHAVPMPAELGHWLAAYSEQHHEPRVRKARGKRRSKAIYDREVGDWAGGEA